MASKHPRGDDLARAMLLLGRLDGRLANSPWSDIWLARAQLSGAADLARLAGAPIRAQDLQDWISGRTAPPRASEGLNDPVSVAAVFHLALEGTAPQADAVALATRNALRAILDDRAQAALWANEDLAHFGPGWRAARAQARTPYPSACLSAVAERIASMLRMPVALPLDAIDVVTADGRAFTLSQGSRDRSWLVASHIPTMLHRAGLTLRPLPSLVLLTKFPPLATDALSAQLAAALLRACQAGLEDLDALERVGPSILPRGTTQRSRLPILARLELAYPGLQPPAIARLLGVTPQGARKLRARLHGSPMPVE